MPPPDTLRSSARTALSRAASVWAAARDLRRRARFDVSHDDGPTLDLGQQQRAAAGVAGRRAVIAAGQITQPWHVGRFSPATITLPEVRAGDAIFVLGVYWGDLPKRSRPEPRDRHGALVVAVEQGPGILGYAKPPVFAHLYYQLTAAAGRHVITPPDLGGPSGDGTLYVLQVRGLSQRSGPIAVGHTRLTGTALADVSVSLEEDARPDDFVVAIGGYDNTTPRPHAGMSHVTEGWISAGVQHDAANNVPSEVCHRLATENGRQRLTWTWKDPNVNVACAAMAAFR